MLCMRICARFWRRRSAWGGTVLVRLPHVDEELIRLASPDSVDGGSDSRHLGLYFSVLEVRAAGAPRGTGEGNPLLSAASTGSH
jgi:hypothetical protein